MAQYIDTTGYKVQNENFQLTGFAEFEAMLMEMSDGFTKPSDITSTLGAACKNAMEPVYYSAIAYAPVDTTKPRSDYSPFHMRDTIELKARLPNDNDRKSAYIGDTAMVIAVVSVKKSAVSLGQEFGTSKIPARPFLRPALQHNVGTVLALLKEELSVIIPAYARKISRKRK
jgi:HK97 gp10 family phage protein